MCVCVSVCVTVSLCEWYACDHSVIALQTFSVFSTEIFFFLFLNSCIVSYLGFVFL